MLFSYFPTVGYVIVG